MNKKRAVLKPTLLDVQQAAAYLSVSPGTIRRWAQNHQLQGLKVGIRGDWRFSPDQLSLLNQHNYNHPQTSHFQTIKRTRK